MAAMKAFTKAAEVVCFLTANSYPNQICGHSVSSGLPPLHPRECMELYNLSIVNRDSSLCRM